MQPCPEILPIFPLTGALLLPGGRLPLHIFEARYRHLVEDSLSGRHFIGMIQPFSAEGVSYKEGGDPNALLERPEIYQVGCAGLIEQWERLPDGRYLVLLLGKHRFRVQRELEEIRGYRRVEADYEAFAGDDRIIEAEISSKKLLEGLRDFSETHGLTLDWQALAGLSGLSLLNSVAMGLPFPPAEKQALLEAKALQDRLELLLTLLEMGVDFDPGDNDLALN